MPRHSTQTLPNVMLESGLFDDEKIVELMDKTGPLGFTIYTSLLFKIKNSMGYYTQMKPSLITAIQRDIGSKWASRDKIIEVIDVLGQGDLISSNLLSEGVVTSVGIQRRYLDTKKKKRAIGFSIEKYWLLSENETNDDADSGIPCKKLNSCNNNPHSCSNNPDKCNNNPYITSTVTVTVIESQSPTLDEVKKFCSDRKSAINPELFFNYYSARDWKIKGEPIRSWQRLVEVWEAREKQSRRDESNEQSGRIENGRAGEYLNSLLTKITDDEG